MRDDGVRLGLLYPGGGAEQGYHLFGEEVQDRVRMFLIETRVGGRGDGELERVLGKTVLTAPSEMLR